MRPEKLKNHLLLFQQQEQERLNLQTDFDQVCRQVVLPTLKEIKYTFRECGLEASTAAQEAGGKINAIMFSFKRMPAAGLEFESHLVLRLANQEIQLETRWCGQQTSPQLEWLSVKLPQITAEWVESIVYAGIRFCYPTAPTPLTDQPPEVPADSEPMLRSVAG